MSIGVSKVHVDLKCFVLPQPPKYSVYRQGGVMKPEKKLEVTSPSLPVFVVERSSSRRASEEG